MKFSLAVALLLLVSCGTMRSQEQPRRAASEIETFGSGETLHYLVLGDSTTVGEGGTYANGIAVMTARHLGAGRRVILKNLGVSGAQVTDVLREQLPRIDGFVPDVVLLAAGANDVTHLTTAGSVKRDLRQIIEALVAINRDVRIVMTGAPDMSTPPRIPRLLRGLAGWRTNALNRVFRAEAERYGLMFAPIAEQTGPLFETDKTLFSSDAFHPNDRGYATWIPVISHALDRALATAAPNETRLRRKYDDPRADKVTRAIIVEPDEGIRSLQRMILRQHAGATEIVERRSVAEAFPVFSTEDFGFAMLDISRPTDELREFLHVSRKKQKSPVIAFTTGKVTRETLQMLVNDHVFAVFPKPFELDEVVPSVRAALEAAKTGTLYPKLFGFLQKEHAESE